MCKIEAVSATESSSNITPEPAPNPVKFAVITVSIKMVGITISFAGIAIMYARTITPFKPNKKA